MQSNGQTTEAGGRGTPPVDRKVRVGALEDLIVGFLLIPLTCAGWAGLLAMLLSSVATPPIARDESTRPFLPVTPLRALSETPDGVTKSAASHAGAPVRVEGFLRGEPPIAAPGPNGVSYALQYLQVIHKVPDGQEGSIRTNDVTDDEQRYQPRLWLDESPGEANERSVEISVPEDWEGYRFHAHPLVGQVETPTKIPDRVAEALALHSVPPQRGQEWTLWALAQHARVTVLAPVRQRGGRGVLALDKEHWCAVSPDPWEDIVDGPWSFIPPWIYLGVCGLLASLPVPWHFFKQRQSRLRG